MQNRLLASVIALAMCLLAVSWSWAMSGALLLLKVAEVLEEKMARTSHWSTGSEVLTEAVLRRIDDPSFWVFVGAGLASAVLLGFIAVSRFRIDRMKRNHLWMYCIFSAVATGIYLLVTWIKSEGFFWRPRQGDEYLAATNIPSIQQTEGLLVISSIFVLYLPVMIVSQLDQWNRGSRHGLAVRAQMNTALIPLSLFALVFFSLTFLPRLFGFAIIDHPVDYLTGLAGAILLLFPYIWVAIRASRTPHAASAKLYIFKMIPMATYLIWMGLSALGLVSRPSSVWVTDASKAHPPWNLALGVADFFGLLGFFVFAWIA